jgi:pilus assembly protein Flp/PilA
MVVTEDGGVGSSFVVVSIGRSAVIQFSEALFGLFASEESEGQGLVEYALIIAFIAVVVIVAMVFLQGRISALFSKVGDSLN